MPRAIAKFLLWSGGAALLSSACLAYFFVANDAPAVRGKVDYHLPYGHGQSLDVYQPTRRRSERSPVVMFIHGGAFITGSKVTLNFNRFNTAFSQLRDAGYTIVSPSYTLARRGQPPFPSCVQDILDAYAWILANADRYDLDVEQIGIMGESAGSLIGMLVAYAAPTKFGRDVDPPRIRYVVNVYGPTSLAGMLHSDRVERSRERVSELPERWRSRLDIAELLLGFHPASDRARAAQIMHQFSPVDQAHASVPPTLTIHGDADRIVPVDQAHRLDARLRELEVAHEIELLEGVDHAFRGATPEQRTFVQRRVLEFIRAHERQD